MISNHAAMPFVRDGYPAPSAMGFAFGQDLDSPMAARLLPVDELELQHVRRPDDFDAVRALRGHIDLAAHLAVDPLFHDHEKKEMSWAWSSRSTCAASLSEPSGRFRCVTA